MAQIGGMAGPGGVALTVGVAWVGRNPASSLLLALTLLGLSDWFRLLALPVGSTTGSIQARISHNLPKHC